jgi:hypothetical protein
MDVDDWTKKRSGAGDAEDQRAGEPSGFAVGPCGRSLDSSTSTSTSTSLAPRPRSRASPRREQPPCSPFITNILALPCTVVAAEPISHPPARAGVFGHRCARVVRGRGGRGGLTGDDPDSARTALRRRDPRGFGCELIPQRSVGLFVPDDPAGDAPTEVAAAAFALGRPPRVGRAPSACYAENAHDRRTPNFDRAYHRRPGFGRGRRPKAVDGPTRPALMVRAASGRPHVR